MQAGMQAGGQAVVCAAYATSTNAVCPFELLAPYVPALGPCPSALHDPYHRIGFLASRRSVQAELLAEAVLIYDAINSAHQLQVRDLAAKVAKTTPRLFVALPNGNYTSRDAWTARHMLRLLDAAPTITKAEQEAATDTRSLDAAKSHLASITSNLDRYWQAIQSPENASNAFDVCPTCGALLAESDSLLQRRSHATTGLHQAWQAFEDAHKHATRALRALRNPS
ncbi:hypothetical protein BC831DRAFT_473482 [Entophlyctis helioformis]|nr:hypothetical protein BC831DRAFT_473482 [Entophlyctis helioformis]